ncbi:TPA: hydantoinase/oxoprolinase family protein [Burkholderia cenocepacia]|nr:hydantoinase/oxoprolinase family protein [Burkholderia cenocepacia]
MTYILAADTGGTFTDLAAYDSVSGRVIYTKSLTNYDDLVEGLMSCVKKADIKLADAETVKFGTTLVINTYVQRNGAKTALITTRGFRDVLELGRGNRPVPFDLRYEREASLISRDLRFGVSERISAQGESLAPLDITEIEQIAKELKAANVEAVAVSFLNSYSNDEHERTAAACLRELLPGVYVSTGTELSREWYEYERTSTVAANAYVGPKLRDYVARLSDRLEREGFKQSFYLMASNGGVFPAMRAQAQPVMLVESGPVGGCIGAGVYAEALGLERVIAFDMGGTTAKCALLENGRFEVKSPYYVGGYERGFPVRGGVLDIVEVGTGGGSIASVDRHGGVHVGPRSAGSTPGPVCYGRGGTEPTITDANLVLGRIAASSFLGGEMMLDEPLARDAISAIANKLGLTGESGIDQTAQGILSLGALTMASAIKQITVERGIDPRDLSMIAFGGGGPLHTAALARELGVPHLIIPPEPGNFSALGMVLADARVDDTHTFLKPLTRENVPLLNRVFEEMEDRIGGNMTRELGVHRIHFERQAELSFKGQKHTVRVPMGVDPDDERIRAAFEEIYKRRYGHVEMNSPIEIINLVLTATATIKRPRLEELSPTRENGTDVAASSRPVYFAESSSRIDTPVYQRRNLPKGFASAGPAIIEEYGSTTVVGPNDEFEVGKLGEIHIRFN